MVTAASAEAEAAKLATTMSGIDKLISYMVAKETVVTAEENMVAVPDKGKKVVDTFLGEKGFDLRHLGGQELSEADKEELKEYGISCGYQPGSMLFDGVDEEILGCIRDCAGAKIIGTLSNCVGFPKLESDINGYLWQHIVDNLFYSNFKVKSLSRFLLS
jgi:methylmalonyl-CoA mutase cobalamin-binding subunit